MPQGQTKDCIDLSLRGADGRMHHLALVRDASGAKLQMALVRAMLWWWEDWKREGCAAERDAAVSGRVVRLLTPRPLLSSFLSRSSMAARP